MSTQNSTLKDTSSTLAKLLSPTLADPSMQNEMLGQDLMDIVKKHALGAAAAGLGVAWVPGEGGLASLAAAVAFIWTMYFRINSRIGLKMSKVLLKSLASAVLTNLVAGLLSVVGTTILSTVLSFTGFGNVMASVMMAAMDYSLIIVSGIVYLKLLNGMFSAGKNPQDLKQDDIKVVTIEALSGLDIKKMVREARSEYVQMHKAGKTQTADEVTLLNDEDGST